MAHLVKSGSIPKYQKNGKGKAHQWPAPKMPANGADSIPARETLTFCEPYFLFRVARSRKINKSKDFLELKILQFFYAFLAFYNFLLFSSGAHA